MSETARTIMLVRHPETIANAESRYIGRMDSPISPRGQRQTEWLARVLASQRVHAVFSSPLGRALTTAETIVPDGVAVRVLGELSEIDFGMAEGLTHDELHARGIRLDYTGSGPIAPEGETGEAFDARVRVAAEFILAGPERSAVITHGGVMRHLLVTWLGLPEDRAWSIAVPHAAVAVLRIDGGTVVLESLTPPPDVCEDRA